jgi:hypothetical protein
MFLPSNPIKKPPPIPVVENANVDRSTTLPSTGASTNTFDPYCAKFDVKVTDEILRSHASSAKYINTAPP